VRRNLIVPAIMVVIGVGGAGIAVYLTSVHYAKVPLVCNSTGVVNCERVLSSSYSSVGGIPISVGGIAWFAVTALFGLVALWYAPEPRWLQPAQVMWGLLGLATAIYLVGVEAIALGVLCAWCTALHALIVAALILAVMRTPATAMSSMAISAGSHSPAGAMAGGAGSVRGAAGAGSSAGDSALPRAGRSPL
jgi:uncharacterized membrane protein